MKRIIVAASSISPADYDALRPRTEGEPPAPLSSRLCAVLWREPTRGEVVDYFADTAPDGALVVIGDGDRVVPEGFVFSHQFAGFEG